MDRSQIPVTVNLSNIDKSKPDGLKAAFRVGAIDYYRSSTLLGSSVSFAPYMLAFHAIELGLKSFLAGQGQDIAYMRKHYGHDLSKLFSESVTLGLAVSVPDAQGYIDWYNEFHSRTVPIRYEFVEVAPLPPLDTARQIAKEIIGPI